TLMSSLRVDAANVQHIPLKVGGRFQRQRGYALGQVRRPGYPWVSFVSIHLGLEAAERARHAAALMKALTGDGPLVVAGDLNEGPDGQAWMTVGRRLRVVTGEAPTFPATNPHRRPDAIFASPTLPAVPTVPISLDPADLASATDHLPVWVDLDLTGLANG
ncbi:MAG: hypothetical protein ABI934_10420, partial [Actinomycetota bacterium]